MTFATYYLISICNIWAAREVNDSFPQHVDGVTIFLNNALAMAEGQDGGDASEPVLWDYPPGYSEFDEPLLTFRLMETPPLLVFREMPLTAIACHLLFEEGEGLFLLWHSRLSETEELSDIHYTQVSPFLSEVQYCYYDDEDEQWDRFDEPEEDLNGDLLLPDFLLLTFRSADLELKRDVFIYLPKVSQSIPMF